MKLSSQTFQHSTSIPKRHTGEGDDASPQLEWGDIPQGTKRLAVICEDRAAPARRDQDYPYVHWVIYNIPANIHALPENIPQNETVNDPNGATQGRNSFGKIGYGGPMPPEGHGLHHYVFTLYALDIDFDFPAGLTKEELLDKLQGHVIKKTELVGTYERPAKGKQKSA